jgi:hypothetical protein
MKALFVLSFLISSSVAFANSGKLQFSGRVTEKVDVRAENGKLVISQNTPSLKITVANRSPASLVRIEAP